nr:argininosuccinate lyase [Gammaproteobacteria bacterium]NIR97762.1 argininosuccinate lyase [Gammaproteobacteria bacterium]NIT63472.1 argininosuccinate lyase [Gammaproteobacteria bacterium]NIV20404.1 argininosuccinate lyase [Gammaproteobacteria bacterium]NIX10922.1 argininosuccinate lyase [Gammaproteobacteria bacterium]
MSDAERPHKPWMGRFTEPTDAFVEEFTASVGFDRRLYRHDIEGSLAHARMLARTGLLSQRELDAITKGLEEIRDDIERGDFAWSTELEDVHMNIEARLTQRIGEAGKKLHTARSRNDQVATDMRLYVRAEIDRIVELLTRAQLALLDLAEREAETIMPGFTHLQVAQPVTFGHHMMAWYEMLARDGERLADCRRRLNVMPLGAAALAGTGFPIDREYTAQELGFERPSANSLDSVSDRDFAIEFAASAALLVTHLSRFSEELVLWSSAQFGFVELADRFCTGSSIMPQKKNPDVPELVRGKAGRVNGNLVALLTLMKGQPLAYNKDNQEDKEPLFDSADTAAACLRAFADMVPAIEPNRQRMLEAAREGFSTATDLADYLVRKGVAFRDAHEIVGRA